MTDSYTARAFCLAICLFLAAAVAAADGPAPGIIDLAGPWLSSSDIGGEAGGNGGAWSEVTLPASWKALDLLGHDGEVRFRRVVALPRGWREEVAPSGLAVMVGEAKFGAFSLWAGDSRLGGYGGGRAKLPAPTPQLFAIPVDAIGPGDRLSLELRFHRVGWASDLASNSGPTGERLLLGDLETMRFLAELDRQRDRRKALHSILIAALLAAVGLYHLQLFSRRRERVEYLWFGLTAIGFAAVIFAVRLSYSLTDSYAVGRRLSGLTVHLVAALLIQLLWPYLQHAIGPWLRRYQLSHLAIAAAMVILPVEWVVRSNGLRWLWILPLLVGLGKLLTEKSWVGDPDARTIGLGVLTVAAAGTVELLLQIMGRGTSYPLPAWAFGLFALSMAISLSNRYSRLHLELDQMRHHLEAEVEDATAELSAANRRLRAENAERQLAEESMRMLERAVEQSIDGMVVSDLAGATEFLNEAWALMHGYEVPEVLGYDLNLFHTREQMQDEVYPLLNQVREEGSFDGEVGHRHKDGSEFPTWMTVNLLLDPEDEPVGVVAIARDITERRQAEEGQHKLEIKLQQAAKLESLGDLAAGIAHDYNNLLTGMMAHADLGLRELDPTSPAAEKIRQIAATAERAADLSDQLLAYAGEDEPEVETARLGDLLKEMEPQLRERISERTVLQYQLKRGLPLVDVDPAQLRRVVLCLVANATDAIGSAEGVLTLRTSRVEAERGYFHGAQPSEDLPASEYVFFEVSDSGIGIDEDARARMFEPFFSTKPEGRGLGLATALGIVGAHHGAIKVYSQPDRGTTIEVLFPASTRPETVIKPQTETDWRPAGTVLVVDDEELVLEVAREILASRGFEVLSASNGKQAVAIFDEHRDQIAAVVLDMTMPEMDGEEVFQELRRMDPEARILLMSGYSRKKVSQLLFEQGLGGFLHKPFRPQDLMDKLRELLEPLQ
ncbi:MAG: response regulator [bacterium]|nr:response regulator [bacterium]